MHAYPLVAQALSSLIICLFTLVISPIPLRMICLKARTYQLCLRDDISQNSYPSNDSAETNERYVFFA
jgi:hypothetical protein